MPVFPLPQPGSLVTIEVLSNGTPIGAEIILSIEVVQALDMADIAKIGIVVEDQLMEYPDFEGGAIIEIRLGYNGRNSSCFQGKVVKQNLHIASDGRPSLTIICEGKQPRETLEMTRATPSDLQLTYGLDIFNLNLDKIYADQTSYFEGAIQFPGSLKAQAGSTIILKDLGKTFSETVFITSVNHMVKQGEWTTSIEIGASDEKKKLR